MNMIAFYGIIYSGDYQVIANILKKWIQSEDLTFKIKLLDEEFVYEDEQFYLYCYTGSNDGGTPHFLLEGNILGIDQAKASLNLLHKICEDQHIIGRFEYVEVSENGNELSEQFYIQ
jgi:hypothetical protein